METVAINEERDNLIEKYRRFTGNLVARFIRVMNLPVELHDELVSAGYLGLVEAAERFDESRGVDFRSYAYRRIQGAVIDAVRQCSELSGKAYTYDKVLQACADVREYHLQLREVQPDHDLSREEKLAQLLEYAAKGALAFRLGYEESEEEVAGTFEDSLNPEEEMAHKGHVRTMRELVESLPEQERVVIREFYFNDKSFVEIARELDGVSKSWVSRLHVKALERLRQELVG